MTRLAWFTPLAPVRSGISHYSRELLPGLCESYAIDVFVDGSPDQFEAPSAAINVVDAFDFAWAHRAKPYDLIVYQMGNARCHDYMWANLVRHPGLVVLHDGQLHHARARYLLQQKKPDDYRAEFRFNHPDAPPDVAELGIAGLLGNLTYFWPMLRVVIESARQVIVHNQWLADDLVMRHPGVHVSVVDMGVPESKPSANAREVIRARHGISKDATLFVSLGKVTPEKRIGEVMRALASLKESGVQARLLIAGEGADHFDAMADASTLGLDGMVSMAGFVGEGEIDDYLAAADVCLCMRWPTTRETSASLLRCLAAGKPVLTTDLAHLADIPAIDARDGSPLSAGEPVAVGVDILDEKHALSLGMRKLAQDAPLRDWLGANARNLWASRFRLDRMVARYREVIASAVATPGSAIDRAGSEDNLRRFPRHLLAAGTEHADRVLRDAGFPGSPAAGVWTHRGE